ncbi:MAG: alpha/beta fold hydrolase [Armatimonadetes bacterium]|nr:alpha/beta fold hydrolase [Armatimonadota bacterium]
MNMVTWKTHCRWPRVVGCALALGTSLIAGAAPERGQPLPRKGVLGAGFEVVAGAAPSASIRVNRLVPGVTAEKIGLKVGDIVQQVNGKPITAVAEIVTLVGATPAGSDLEIQVLREDKPLTIKGKLMERPRQKGDGYTVDYDQVVSKGKRIRMIVTHPKSKGPFPTIFMIGGIGAYSMDGEYAATPYGNILEPLTKAGYAVVRIDKPGQGDSEGPLYKNLLFDDEEDAYLQALRLAKTLPAVDSKKVIILGHSMGGCFGPLVAAEEPVAGVIAIATLSKTWDEYMLENSRRQSLLAGASPAAVDQEMKKLAAINTYMFYEGLSVNQIAEKHPELAETIRAMSPDGETYSGVGVPFFQQLAKKNLMEAWAKANTKVLTMWGECDFVSGRADHEFVAEELNKLRPGSSEFKMIPQSDHGFSKTTSFRDSMEHWGRGGVEFNPIVITMIQDWLKKTLG